MADMRAQHTIKYWHGILVSLVSWHPNKSGQVPQFLHSRQTTKHWVMYKAYRSKSYISSLAVIDYSQPMPIPGEVLCDRMSSPEWRSSLGWLVGNKGKTVVHCIEQWRTAVPVTALSQGNHLNAAHLIWLISVGPRLVHDTIKSSGMGHPGLAWAVIGLKEPRGQDSLNTHYQQKIYWRRRTNQRSNRNKRTHSQLLWRPASSQRRQRWIQNVDGKK